MGSGHPEGEEASFPREEEGCQEDQTEGEIDGDGQAARDPEDESGEDPHDRVGLPEDGPEPRRAPGVQRGHGPQEPREQPVRQERWELMAAIGEGGGTKKKPTKRPAARQVVKSIRKAGGTTKEGR